MTRSRAHDLRRIVELAWPVLIGQLAVVGFTTIDTLLVARFARDDLAALAVGAAAYITIFVGLMGVVLALGPIVGQLFGAGDRVAAGRQLHQSVWLALALSVVGSTVLVFPYPFLALAQAPDAVEAKIRGYLLALAVALPAALLVQTYRGFNNAISRPKAVMALQIGALFLKLPLSMLLVFGLPSIGLPALGVVGCGIATAIVMWLMAGAALAVLRRDRFYDPFQLRGRGLHRPDLQALAAQLRLGVPMGLSIMVEVSGFSMMAVFIARLGAVATAGHQIAANLAAILFMMPLALASATMTLVAQRVGAQDPDDARSIGWRGLQLAALLAAVMAAALALARGPVASLYSADAAVRAVALPLIGWLALFMVADAVQIVASFVLRAYRVAVSPMLIYAAALWGLGLGGGYVLAFDPFGFVPPAWQGARGYWMAATGGLTVAALALTWLMVVVLRVPPGPLRPAAGAA